MFSSLYRINLKHIFSGELAHTIKLSCPKIIFASSATKLINITDQCPFLKTIVEFDSQANSTNENVMIYNNFLESSTPTLDFECESVDIQDNVCLILYSSGTTGLPKAVQLTQANVICGIEQKYTF